MMIRSCPIFFAKFRVNNVRCVSVYKQLVFRLPGGARIIHLQRATREKFITTLGV